MRFLRLGALFVLWPATAFAANPRPWDGPAFTAGAADTMAAARAIPAVASEPVIVLLEEAEYRYETDGRRTYRYRQVYRVESDAAREDWASVSASWSPWHQERPELRARVIGPDGSDRSLDPATIAESGVGEEGEAVYSDRRRLEAPLPALVVGSVVEAQAIVRDTSPSFAPGTTGRYYFGSSAPLLRSRLLIDVPAGVPLHWVARLLPKMAPRREEIDGRVRLLFEASDVAQLESLEPGLPPDVPRWPHVAFSTASSWAAVASSYSGIVDQQLAGANVQEIAREVARGASGRQALVERLLAEVHRRVRYTGIEFGEASIVPRPPREVLDRHYGDCKDKATLLVGLLRSSGIPAHVALVSTGGEDIPDEPPGLGAFDHAVVYVPGAPALWIDATAERARAGEVPMHVQGRLALVAAAGSTDRIRVPETSAAQNGSTEEREFRLAEDGPAHVIEITEYAGSHERYFRDQYSDRDPDKQRKTLVDYVKNEYAAEELVAHRHTPAAELARPFRLELEAARARRGLTDDKEAVVEVFPGNLANDLPKEIKGGEEKDVAPRQAPYHFASPFFLEYRYRITPPPGFDLAATPSDEDVPLGAGRLTARWTTAADGVVRGVLRLESGPRRIDAATFESMKAAVRELRARPAALVRFSQRGEKLREEGRFAEALDEFRRLAALHPREALHHTQSALTLLAAGLGEAARVEARAALAAEPTSSLAHRRLGWVLQHDLIGRRFGKGFDPAGAVAAYRRAEELAPDDLQTRLNLAYLLEHNAEGERWGAGAKLSDAADEYWRLSREYGEHHVNLPHVLARSNRYGELAEAAKGFKDASLRDYWEVAAAALTDGPAAAVRRAARIADAKERREALVDAGEHLVRHRRYAEGASLLLEAAPGAENAAALRSRAEMLSRVRRIEDVGTGPGPQGAVRALLLAMWSGRSGQEIVRLLAAPLREVHGASAGADTFAAQWRAFERERRTAEMPAAPFIDIMMSLIRTGVEGDDAVGYRVRAQGAWTGANAEVWWVVREGNDYRVLCSGAGPSELGSEAVRRLSRGDLVGARRMLDWAREQVSGPASDPLGGNPLVRFWTVGEQAGPDAIRAAAASLLVGSADTAAEAVRTLELARQAAAGDAERERVDLAVLEGLLTLDRHEEALSLAERIAARHASSPLVFWARVSSLAGLSRWPEVERLAEQRMQALPGDADAARALRISLAHLGRLPAIEALCAPLLDSGRADAVDFNECAWNGLFVPAAEASAMARARRAVELSARRQAAYLHTLATLHAEAGQPADARTVILEAISASGRDEPSSHDWYVFGRIAEAYGVRDAAAAAYARVERDEAANATWRLAQRRLSLLRGRERPPRTTAATSKPR